MRIWLIRIGIIAVIAVGGSVLRGVRLSSDAGDLKVGECFDDPAGATRITDVHRHPCTEAHNAEVVYLGKLPDGDSKFPTTTTVQDWVRANCVPAWSAYTGKDFESELTLELGFYQPSPESWGSGDRHMVCYAVRSDSAPLTTSVKAAP
jgi:Septum formation